MIDVNACFRAHHDSILRYLVGLTGDVEVAADAAQEAFVRLIERPPASVAQIRAWLYRVATNVALDVMRGSARRAAVLSERPDVLESVPVSVPDEQLEQSERHRFVHSALRALRPPERAVLLMRAQGFSYREIAEALDVPMNSIGAIGARGLRKLAVHLGPREAQL